ncbi:MAG: ABC transporter permease [Candidatus Merdivicinus sp.]|jgi:putative aldouronate transport system permease protein
MQQSTTQSSGMYRKFRKSEWYKYIKYRYLFLMFIPAILYYAIFCYGPLYGIQLAFKDYRFLDGIGGSPWVGLKHFETMFAMNSFKEVFFNTLIISGLKFIFGFPAPILFAILLNEIVHTTYKKVIQTISYLPHFVSWVVLAGIFTQFLSPSVGPINMILKSIGIEPIYFLADPKWFRTVLVVTHVWKSIGWGSIIYLAAITGVNPELHEAATIDGANRFQRIWNVTLPAITPVITIMLIMAVGSLINDDFDQIFNLYNPAVYRVGDVIGTYVYRKGLVDMEYGFSTAVGLFKNVISFALIILTNAITKRINEYGIW